MLKNLFISHADMDKGIVKELLYLLNDMGLKEKYIICSGFPGRGVDPGEDVLGFIKKRLTEDTLAVFVISRAFYDSSKCQSQLGAVWAKTSNHIGILIPPIEFSNITYAFCDRQCITVLDEKKLDDFYDTILKWFRIKAMDDSIWEKKKRRFIMKMTRALNMQGEDHKFF